MRVGIEGSVLQRKHKTGVDYYTWGLVQSVIRQMPSDEFEVGYFKSSSGYPDLQSKNVEYKVASITYRLYNILFRYLVPKAYDRVTKMNADVVLFPNFVRWPLNRINKSVVVVYDTAYIDKPEYVPTRLKKYLTRFVPKAVNKADRVIAISESTKKAIIKHYRVDESKIAVINPALDHAVYRPVPSRGVEKVKNQYGIKKEYLLYLGTIEPRKNIASIIKAYSQLPDGVRSKYQLVLAGGKGWLDDDIEALISNSNPGEIVKTGYIEDKDKPALYTGAEVFIYPSIFEGWGMQVVEAMACGTPVITADNSSLPEAGGKAAAYVKAGNDSQLTCAIQDMLKNKSSYNMRVKLGLEHAAKFTWEKSGSQLKTVFKDLGGQS